MKHPVTRGARRACARKHPPRTSPFKWDLFCQKRWENIYLRKKKMLRVQKTGRIWPHPKAQWDRLLAETGPLNVLFICSRNKWRSPTGEAVFRKMPGVAARSAGTSSNARRTVRLDHIKWADLIFVMEEKHASRLRAEFRQAVRHKPLHVLDIPDDYTFMKDELVALFEETAGPLIETALEI